MADTIPVKLPNNLITIALPAITGTQQLNYSYDDRITEDSETRITEDGETRILDAFDIYSYPELVVVKIPNGLITVNLP